MHTFILTTITSLLLLPLLALPGQSPDDLPLWRPPTWPPPNIKAPYYWSDVLNITKCYCQGINGDNRPSNYWRFDYRNIYNSKVYTLGWKCDSRDLATGWAQEPGSERMSFLIPECWNGHSSWRKHKRMACVENVFKESFCYEFGNGADPYDYYYFNGQKRKVPDWGVREFPPDMCPDLCRDKAGGKVASK